MRLVLRSSLACLALFVLAGRAAAVESHAPSTTEQRSAQIADVVLAAPLNAVGSIRGAETDKRVNVPFLALLAGSAAASAVFLGVARSRHRRVRLTHGWPRVRPALRAPPLRAVSV